MTSESIPYVYMTFFVKISTGEKLFGKAVLILDREKYSDCNDDAEIAYLKLKYELSSEWWSTDMYIGIQSQRFDTFYLNSKKCIWNDDVYEDKHAWDIYINNIWENYIVKRVKYSG